MTAIVKQAWLRRLERVEREQKGKRRTHYLFLLPGETSPDAQIQGLIASGEASRTDEFIAFCWAGSPTADTPGKPPDAPAEGAT